MICNLRPGESLISCAKYIPAVCARAVDAPLAASATTSKKATECHYTHQPPMTLQRAAEARSVNTLMREPHVATRASEVLDYAGWIHPLAAADVLAGETTEKRRCVTVSSLVPS